MAAPLSRLVHIRILCTLSRNFTLQANLASNTDGDAGQRLYPVFLNVSSHGQAARTLHVTRQYGRRAQPQAVGTNVTDHENREETPSEGNGKKRTRGKTRKKKDSYSTSAPRTESGITLNFPFEGEGKRMEAATNTDTASDQEASPFTAHVINQQGGRVYSIHSGGEVYNLPSVTTILGSTLPDESRFMLYNWKRSIVKERGEEGYREVVDKTRVLGTQFHKVGCHKEVGLKMNPVDALVFLCPLMYFHTCHFFIHTPLSSPPSTCVSSFPHRHWKPSFTILTCSQSRHRSSSPPLPLPLLCILPSLLLFPFPPTSFHPP